RVHGRANRAPASIAPSASQDAWQELLYCSAQGLGYRSSGVSAGLRRPNESFKPKPLRYAVQAAGKACHLARSTTRLSLTLVLGTGGKDVCTQAMDVGDLGSGGRVLPRRNRGLDRNGPPGLLAHSRGRLLRGLGGCP